MRSLALLVLSLPLFVMADPQFTNITDTDMKDIAKGLGSNFTHNSMMGASKLGTIFGFQVGVTAAQTAVPKIDDIAKENSGSKLPNIYNAGIMAAVGIPFGLSFEAVVMPTYKADGAKAESSSFGLKLNINELIPVLPINLAVRGVHSSAEFSFKQTVSSLEATVSNKTTVSGAQLLLSPMFPIVEPYVGVGFLSAKNKLEVTNTTGTIFDSSLTTGQSASKTVSGTQVLAGVEANLLLLKLGAEYSQAFGNSRYGVKLSFGF